MEALQSQGSFEKRRRFPNIRGILMVAPAHLCIGKEKAPNLLASLPIDSFSNEF